MSLTQITDHADRAAARLASKLAGKPRFEALVRALVAPFQSIEDALWQLFESDVNTATGAALDVYGRIVGEPRSGETDDELYRRRVRARIMANRSNGTVEDIIRVVKLILVDDEARIHIRQIFPASILVELEDVAIGADVADIVAAFVSGRTRGAAAAAIGTRVVHSEYDVDDTFRLAISTYAETITAGANSFLAYIRDRSETVFPAGGGLVELRGDDSGTERTEVLEYAAFVPVDPTASLPTYYRFYCKTGETIRYSYPYKANPFRGGVDGALVSLVEPTVQRGIDDPVTVTAGTFDIVITAGATHTVTVPQGYYSPRQFAAIISRYLWQQNTALTADVVWSSGWKLNIAISAGSITINNFSSVATRDQLGFSANQGPVGTIVANTFLNTGDGGRLARDAEAA